MTSRKVLYSIIVPTFGRSLSLRRTLMSVKNQSISDWECIIINDNPINSSDYFRVIQLFSSVFSVDQRFKLLSRGSNKGASFSRNEGAKYSSGLWLLFLDDDDELFMNRLKLHKEFVVLKEDIKISYCLSYKATEYGLIFKSFYSKSGDLTVDILSNQIDFNTSSLVIHIELFNRIGGFDSNFKRHQDYEFLLRCFQFFEIKCEDERLLNVYLDDRRNELNFDELRNVKMLYLKKFGDIISRQSNRQKCIILFCNDLDLILAGIKKGEFFKSLPLIIKYFWRIDLYYLLIPYAKRFLNRKGLVF